MTIEKDEDGFLLDPDDWSEELAIAMAKAENLELSKDHWHLIHLIRNYFYEHHAVPEMRKIMQQLKIELGPDKATRKYVYTLFPYGYGQQGCKIAGMRQPKKLWLDL